MPAIQATFSGAVLCSLRNAASKAPRLLISWHGSNEAIRYLACALRARAGREYEKHDTGSAETELQNAALN